MDTYTGRVYSEEELDQLAEEKRAQLVEITGTPEQVAFVSAAVRAAHKKRRKAQRKARRLNR